VALAGDSDDLPADPDYDSVPDELVQLQDLRAPVIVLDESGVSSDTLVIVPSLWAAARRLREADE
jgi:hypothetical protein